MNKAGIVARPRDRLVRTIAVKPRACGVPLSGLGA